TLPLTPDGSVRAFFKKRVSHLVGCTFLSGGAGWAPTKKIYNRREIPPRLSGPLEGDLRL
ncbi:MAG: hypothetical protein PVF59_09415, partial [Desulfobacterales bacterium]